ncbi:MAG TPA: hypothetical protein VFP84_36580 [Kofleriaceae bacterium]|nr:hypothetical protein [Kofleriaceae bacterium]
MARTGILVSVLALGCATAIAAPGNDKDQGKEQAKGKEKDKPAASAATTKKAAAAKAKAAKRRRFAAMQAHISSPSDAADTPAVRYGALSQDDCEAALRDRNIDFVREDAVGVLAPVRVAGPLHGVTFRTDGKEDVRATSPYEIADCRLVLALDDFAEILAAHDIVEVRHYSMYRPPHGWPDDKIGGQHNGALALDAGRFIDKAGHTLDVLHDFHGRIGGKTCGDGAGPHPATPDAVALREILCEAVDRHLFNVVLTPNYNRPHRNHFHLEVMSGARWFLVH